MNGKVKISLSSMLVHDEWPFTNQLNKLENFTNFRFFFWCCVRSEPLTTVYDFTSKATFLKKSSATPVSSAKYLPNSSVYVCKESASTFASQTLFLWRWEVWAMWRGAYRERHAKAHWSTTLQPSNLFLHSPICEGVGGANVVAIDVTPSTRNIGTFKLIEGNICKWLRVGLTTGVLTVVQYSRTCYVISEPKKRISMRQTFLKHTNQGRAQWVICSVWVMTRWSFA